jgi:WD40 repeat protein
VGHIYRKELPALAGGHAGLVWSVAASADGRWLASGGSRMVKRLASAGERVKLWDLTTGQEVFSLPGNFRVAFGRDGRRLVSCGPGNTLLVWSAPAWGEEEKAARRRALMLPAR